MAMKRLLLILLTILSLGNIVIYAEGMNNRIEIVFQQIDSKDINMPFNKDKGPISRSINIPIAYAYIYNNVISINFNEDIEVSTVTITNEATGEIVYSETCSNQANLEIDLSNENGGSYIIEIEGSEYILKGHFNI